MFGCTCHEIVFRKPPFPEYTPPVAAVKVVKEKIHPLVPQSEKWPVIAEIMESCFYFDPSLRPTFDEICETLKTARPLRLPVLPSTKTGNTQRSQPDTTEQYISMFFLCLTKEQNTTTKYILNVLSNGCK